MVYGSTRPHNKTYVNQNINTTTDTTLLSPSRFTNLKNKIAHAVMSSQLFFFRLAAKGDIKRNIHRIHTTTCECVPQSLCDMLHSSNIWILSHFPPLLCIVHRLQRVGKSVHATIGRGKRNEIKRAHPPTLLT